MNDKLYRAAIEGRLFSVANQAAVAVTAAFATTFTGLAVGNPAGSGVDCILVNMSFGNTVEGISVGTVGIMGAAGSITASLVPKNHMMDGAASKCTATAGQTIATPALWRLVGHTGTGAVTTWRAGVVSCDLNAPIVIPPGYFWATYCFALAAASIQFSFSWEEAKSL